MIEQIIKTIKETTGLTVYAFAAPKIEKCVVYNYYPTNDNGATQEARIDIRIIAFSFAECLKIKKQITSALMQPGDGSKIKDIKSIVSNGGGTLEDLGSKTTQLFLYFNITMKSEVN